MQLCHIPQSYKAADTKFHNNKIIWNNYIFILHILTSIKELTLVIDPNFLPILLKVNFRDDPPLKLFMYVIKRNVRHNVSKSDFDNTKEWCFFRVVCIRIS